MKINNTTLRIIQMGKFMLVPGINIVSDADAKEIQKMRSTAKFIKAGRLEFGEKANDENGSGDFDLAKASVDGVKTYISDVTNTLDLETLASEEKQGKNRSGVLKAIEKRIEEIIEAGTGDNDE